MEKQNYLQMPDVMRKQAEEGKMDRYMEITRCLLDADAKITDAKERCLYIKALLDTISEMDFQVYELYRSLTDAFRSNAKCLLSVEQWTVLSDESKETLSETIQRACTMGILNPEKYSETCCSVEQNASDQKEMECAQKFRLKVLMKSPRSVSFEIQDGGYYYTIGTYQIFLNGKRAGETRKVVTSLFDLKPETVYHLQILNEDGICLAETEFTTEYEFVTLNVKDFGAKGDGISNDTSFIQAAILSCPENGRVLVPAGVYKITSLFLKSNLRLELAEGAELSADTIRENFPRFPGVLQSYDEKSEYHLGTWEGNPLPVFTSIITGVYVENVLIYGKGTINGNASKENWWKDPKALDIAYRPRLFFINHCRNVVLQGITCCNSPSWTLHPFFSDDLGFYDVFVNNPSDSPNTDGLDPESCKHVNIAGVHFSLGDDCIAVKAGKIYMGKTYKRSTEYVSIRHCLMERGHGAVTIGSEMAGGVKNLVVEQCEFSNTDRGLRIKTRRGRGRDAVVDRVIFRDIQMDHVMTPFVANSFYCCDPDGTTSYVQSREVMPVDERTPEIRTLIFENIEAKNCHVAAAYFDGLPEKKIEEIIMKNVSVSYAENPMEGEPSMAVGVKTCVRKGVFANNVKKLCLDHVNISGQLGEAFELSGIDELMKTE